MIKTSRPYGTATLYLCVFLLPVLIALGPACLAVEANPPTSETGDARAGVGESSRYRPIRTLDLDFSLANPCRNLVANGSFESPRVSGSYDQLPKIAGWQLSRGSKFELQRKVFESAADGAQYLELAAEEAGAVSQAIATTAGDLYALEFSYSPRPGHVDNRVQVKWNGEVVASLDGSGKGLKKLPWRHQQVLVTGTGAKIPIEFVDASTSDSASGFIDNVTICRVERLDCDNLLVNGSFETPAVNGTWSHLAQVQGWQLSKGPSFELQRGLFGGAAHGRQHLELASSSGIGVQQSAATEAGADYLLSYAYSPRPGNADNRVVVGWGKTRLANLTADGRGNNAVDWKHHYHRVRASGSSARLEFRDVSRSVPAAGGFIDDVRLCQLTQ